MRIPKSDVYATHDEEYTGTRCRSETSQSDLCMVIETDGRRCAGTDYMVSIWRHSIIPRPHLFQIDAMISKLLVSKLNVSRRAMKWMPKQYFRDSNKFHASPIEFPLKMRLRMTPRG